MDSLLQFKRGEIYSFLFGSGLGIIYFLYFCNLFADSIRKTSWVSYNSILWLICFILVMTAINYMLYALVVGLLDCTIGFKALLIQYDEDGQLPYHIMCQIISSSLIVSAIKLTKYFPKLLEITWLLTACLLLVVLTISMILFHIK